MLKISVFLYKENQIKDIRELFETLLPTILFRFANSYGDTFCCRFNSAFRAFWFHWQTQSWPKDYIKQLIGLASTTFLIIRWTVNYRQCVQKLIRNAIGKTNSAKTVFGFRFSLSTMSRPFLAGRASYKKAMLSLQPSSAT